MRTLWFFEARIFESHDRSFAPENRAVGVTSSAPGVLHESQITAVLPLYSPQTSSPSPQNVQSVPSSAATGKFSAASCYLCCISCKLLSHSITNPLPPRTKPTAVVQFTCSVTSEVRTQGTAGVRQQTPESRSSVLERSEALHLVREACLRSVGRSRFFPTVRKRRRQARGCVNDDEVRLDGLGSNREGVS